ncbi:Polysaccharide deacetylase [Halorubrum californiense DSM 19288]|uniref:Polysaccharide deacetylase n=2 Tax=Haloferacaceae TaxID=1644056 RepID=M0E0V9_9EURY|nr:Polysaccharide deacetylase [Halorubrum californiense DSM 19288]
MHDLETFSHLSRDRAAEERVLSDLLQACRRNGIQVTFDVVGHLLEESCDGVHPGPYPTGWWKNDPGTSRREHPLFYAPDLVEKIRSDSIDHEICTHTYSHVLADEVSDKTLNRDLTAARAAHEEQGLPSPESIVMPRHREVDYSILSDHGIDVIRTPIKKYNPEIKNPFQKYWWIATRNHPPCEIRLSQGLLETTCTPHPSLSSTILPSGQRRPSPYFRLLPRPVRERLHRRYLRDAIGLAAEEDEHVHLWTHLHNIANDSQWRAIKPTLDDLGRCQEQGDAEILRMCDLREVVE